MSNEGFDLERLKSLRARLRGASQKEAFAPMPPASPNAPAQPDPAMMAAGGGMPMDPSMMGGMPPMDPALAGASPPPEGMAPPGGGQVVQVSLDDLRALLAEQEGGEPGAPPKTGGRVTNRELNDKIDELSQVVYSMAAMMGAAPPPGETGGAMPEDMAGAAPEDLAAALAGGPAPPGAGPAPGENPFGAPAPPEAPPMQLTAAEMSERDGRGTPGFVRDMIFKLKQNR